MWIPNGAGLIGNANNGFNANGVRGVSTNGVGVRGVSNNTGVWGTGLTYGVKGSSQNNYGVSGNGGYAGVEEVRNKHQGDTAEPGSRLREPLRARRTRGHEVVQPHVEARIRKSPAGIAQCTGIAQHDDVLDILRGGSSI